MFGDFIAACFLVFACACVLLCSFNRTGYAFTKCDCVVFGGLSVLAFSAVYGMTVFIVSLW